MPVVVPPPGWEQLDISQELASQRYLTHWFILSDPTTIVLTPVTETQLISGGVYLVDGTPRAVQIFRLIPMSHTERPVAGSTGGGAPTDEGVQRRYDFTILGEWNADLAENDWWEDVDGQHWKIDSMLSNNGYEKKGMVTSFGRTPTHG